MKSYSQVGQDLFVINYFGNDYKGIFIDIGANDGITFSNTKLLEEFEWTGICIEPIKKTFDKLVKNRNCICHNIAIDNFNGTKKFLELNGYSEMLSGIIDNFDPKHLERINREIVQHGGNKIEIEINVKKFSDVIDLIDIDYISIDVEGSELNILKSIDFNKHKIKIFGIENNYPETFSEIENFLKLYNYTILSNIGHDVFFKLNE